MTSRKINICDINERIQKDPQAFVNECEDRYNSLISDISEKLINYRETSPVVLLTGPSSSGKTTTADRIKENLAKYGVTVHTVSLDDYYLTREMGNIPKDEFGQDDLESPYCLDLKLLKENIHDILDGKEVFIPKYDFKTHVRLENFEKFKLSKGELVIFEGIHALNDEIIGENGDKAVKIYIVPNAELELEDGTLVPPHELRLCRRMVRDRNFRGAEFIRTLEMWASVRRGEKLYIDPFKGTAQFTADTYLAYEAAIFMNILNDFGDELKNLLTEMGHQDIINAMDKFTKFDYKKYIPENSLLREFLG